MVLCFGEPIVVVRIDGKPDPIDAGLRQYVSNTTVTRLRLCLHYRPSSQTCVLGGIPVAPARHKGENECCHYICKACIQRPQHPESSLTLSLLGLSCARFVDSIGERRQRFLEARGRVVTSLDTLITAYTWEDFDLP